MPRPSRLTRRRPFVGILADLHADHQLLAEALERLCGGEAASRPGTFRRFYTAVLVHGRMEEELLYAEVRRTMPDGEARRLAIEGYEEHDGFDWLLERMRVADAASEQFRAQCAVLRRQLQEHLDVEERRLFPAVLAHLGPERLEELGRQARVRRLELLEQLSLPQPDAVRLAPDPAPAEAAPRDAAQAVLMRR